MQAINIPRAIIGTAVSEPLKCSPNMQLAINASNHIALIEPKNSSLYQCIDYSSVEGTSSTFDYASLFEVRSTFHIESLEALGFQIFSRILIEDKENMFNFSRIAEPNIVDHSWSPIERSSRDCYLGVLLNTGEVFVLKRHSTDASNYSIRSRSFSTIIEQMMISQDRLTSEGDIILTGDQFSELRVTAFSFGSAFDGSLLLGLARESSSITIHKLTDSLPLLQRIHTADLVVKMVWSTEEPELYYVLRDNSVWGCKFDENMNLSSGPVKIKSASRFLVSHLHFHDASRTLLIADTTTLCVASLDSTCISAPLPYRSMLVNLSAIEQESSIIVLLPFENGRLSVAKIDKSTRNISIDKIQPFWEAFHNQILHKYQAQLMKEQNRASSKAFQPYLVEAVEGQLSVHGFLPILSSGLAAVAYSLSPKQIISHNIKSRKEFNVNFISLNSIVSFNDCGGSSMASSVSYLSAMILNRRGDIPHITKDVKDGKKEALDAFLKGFRSWKASLFVELSHVKLCSHSNKSLSKSLIQNFRDNVQIHALQKLYSFNLSYTKTLTTMKSFNKCLNDALNDELVSIASEQDLITSKIRTQLASVVVQWASEQSDYNLDTSLDSYLLNTYRLVLLQSNIASHEIQIPETIKLTISTDLCTEMFELSKEEVLSSLKSVVSSSKHSWPRCDMTLLPILDLSNKMDELESHNYLSARRDESFILSTVFDCLDHCIYTGCRTFDLKLGV